MMRRFSVWIGIAVLLLGWSSPLAAQRHRIKMGTLAPDGSPWHDALLQMGQEWTRISGGKLTLKIYPGGRMGDEATMITKMQAGQLQSLALSGAGMSRMSKAIMALHVPMMFDSFQELDYVLERVAPRLEKILAEKGFVVVNWSEAGWVHFFSKKPASTIDDIRRMRLYTASGDPEALELYRTAGFQPVPLAITDMRTSLQTGMIDAFSVPPLVAMLNQWTDLAGNMIDVKWAPLLAATIVDKKVWDELPSDWRPKLLAAARKHGALIREQIHRMGTDTVAEMERRGLSVVRLDEKAHAAWRREAEKFYPQIRGSYVPADLFDEVKRLRDEYRSRNQAGS